MQTQDYCRVPLLRANGEVRGYVKYDQADAEWLERWTWRLVAGTYAGRTEWMRGQNRSQLIYMHRALLGIERGDGREVDHINRDRLDNRRANLRIVSRQQNSENLTQRLGTKSGARGVYWDNNRQCWWVQVERFGKRHWGGYFKDLDEAKSAAVLLRRRVMTHAED